MRITLCVTLSIAVMLPARAGEAQPPAPILVEVEQGDGSRMTGRLEQIDAATVRLVDDGPGGGSPVSLPGDRVRAVQRANRVADGPQKLVLTLLDGSSLAGDDFAWDGKQAAVLVRPEGRVELPIGRVRSIAWRREAATGDAPPAWLGTLPEGTESDLVVVGTDENPEFVECAITGVSAESVTVVLDEETIPVKRSKVIGLQWLRGEPTAAEGKTGRTLVAVTGGGLRASRVDWSPAGLIVDGEIRLPAGMLLGVDYASGRTVGLASLKADTVVVEPWFGGLVRTVGGTGGLAGFFAPRTLDPKTAAESPAAGGRVATAATTTPGIIMRPRTVAVWRLPADSRRFRTVVAAAAGPQAADPVVVAVAVDDRELFRRQLGAAEGSAGGPEADGEGIPIDVDLTSARRLTVTVDFVPGEGVGGAVRFTSPVIER